MEKKCDVCGETVARGKRHRGCNALYKAVLKQNLTPKETKRAGQTILSNPKLSIICPGIIGK
jgi:hypothetical protein